MSEPLAALRKTVTQEDYNSKLGGYRTLVTDTEELLEEVRKTLDQDGTLTAEERKQVRTAYEEVLSADVQHVLTGTYGIDEFQDAVEDIHEELEDVLRNPQAESVVDRIDSWLISTGLEPLSKEVRQTHRGIIVNDLARSRDAVEEAIKAHDRLRGHLGEPQKNVDQLLREDITDASSASDLIKISDGLQKLNKSWPGDWTLNYDLEIGAEFNQQIWELLIGELQDDIAAKSSLSQVAILVENRQSRIRRALDTIDENWQVIESEFEKLPTNTDFNEDRLLVILEEAAGSKATLSSYRSSVQAVSEALEELRQVANRSIEHLRVTADPLPESLADEFERVNETVRDAQAERNAALSASDIEAIEEHCQQFSETVSEAEEIVDEIRKELVDKITTARKLASKFELEQKQTLSEILQDCNTADSISELLEVYNEYQTAYAVVRETVRADLSESQEALFTQLLERSGDLDCQNFETVLERDVEADTKKLLADLNVLRENNLVELTISVN